MRWAVVGSFGWLQGFAGVSPVEGMGHGRVVVIQESAQLIFEVLEGGEVSASDDFSHDDAEDRLDLVEPGTVLGEVHKADAMRALREKRATTGLVF